MRMQEAGKKATSLSHLTLNVAMTHRTQGIGHVFLCPHTKGEGVGGGGDSLPHFSIPGTGEGEERNVLDATSWRRNR